MMKRNNIKILGYYLNKPVYRINGKFNEGEFYTNFNNCNFTLPKWKADPKSALLDAIECITAVQNMVAGSPGGMALDARLSVRTICATGGAG
jgi:hypothetical protein